MKFRLNFHGRRIGAIGIFYSCSVVVEADNSEDAAWKAYDTHQHIYLGVDGVHVAPVPDDTPVSVDDHGPTWDLERREPGQQRQQVNDNDKRGKRQ